MVCKSEDEKNQYLDTFPLPMGSFERKDWRKPLILVNNFSRISSSSWKKESVSMSVNEYKVNRTSLIKWSPICCTVHVHVTVRAINKIKVFKTVNGKLYVTRSKSQCGIQVSVRVIESYITDNCRVSDIYM